MGIAASGNFSELREKTATGGVLAEGGMRGFSWRLGGGGSGKKKGRHRAKGGHLVHLQVYSYSTMLSVILGIAP